jgi:hypothetical protein
MLRHVDVDWQCANLKIGKIQNCTDQEVLDLSITAVTDLTPNPPLPPKLGRPHGSVWQTPSERRSGTQRQRIDHQGRSAVTHWQTVGTWEAYDVRRLSHLPMFVIHMVISLGDLAAFVYGFARLRVDRFFFH